MMAEATRTSRRVKAGVALRGDRSRKIGDRGAKDGRAGVSPAGSGNDCRPPAWSLGLGKRDACTPSGERMTEEVVCCAFGFI